MITKLYNINDDLLTDIVEQSIVNLQPIHIINNVLDGSPHIQVIGDPSKNIDIACLIYEPFKTQLDNIYARGEPVKLVKQGKWYKGLITEFGKWELFSIGQLFSIEFKLVVSSEGVI